MENPVLQIKDALIRVLKKIDPDTDVFFEEIKSTDPAHGVEQPKTWYFVDLKPGSPVTVDGIYTDMSVMVDVTYHEKGESNNTYLIKAAEIDAAIRPVLSFGDRKITIGNADINVVDHVLHYIFTINFRHSEEQNVYNKVDDVDFTQWTEDNYNYLKLIYEGAPSKVIAMRVATNVESYNAVLKKLKDLKWNYLCIPGIKAADTTMIGAWIKQYRNDEKKTFKVVLPHYAGDHEGIINFTTENITSSVTGKKHTAAEYCARIAGILAGLSLSRSSTFYVLNDVSSAEVPDDPNERIDAGELILTFDGSQNKIGRGVNSLTSFTATKTEDFRKIKIVEGMDLYMDDIRDTFEKYYVGKVINDYDNKQMFVAAISSYHKELLGDVLDRSYDNTVSVDVDAQRNYLEGRGTDTSEMDDTAVAEANTGSKVFVTSNVKFVDAMEDLKMTVNM